MSYASVQEFKDSIYYVGIEDFFLTNTQISGFLDGVAAIIDNYCGRTFVTGQYSDVFIGNGNGTRFLDNMPLISIESINYQYFDGTSSSSGSLTAGQYFSTRQGCVKSIVRFSQDRIWTINYTAGYQTAEIPAALKEANMMLAKIMADSADAGNLAIPEGSALNRFKFDKFEEEYVAGSSSSKYEPDSLPPTIVGILKKFKYSRAGY